MKKLIKFLASKIKYIIFIYVLIQIVLILTTNTNYRSDALYYYKLAQGSIEQNEFYPAQPHFYEDYIVAPLYINAIIILLKIFNSTITICLFNLVVILLQIIFLYKITKPLFSETIARLTILLLILYFNTLGLMFQNYTELFFLLLITLSIYFYISNKNIYYILAGVFLGGATAVRPMGWALFAAFVLIQLIKSIKNKKVVLNYFYIYAGMLIFYFIWRFYIFTLWQI